MAFPCINKYTVAKDFNGLFFHFAILPTMCYKFEISFKVKLCELSNIFILPIRFILETIRLFVPLIGFVFETVRYPKWLLKSPSKYPEPFARVVTSSGV